MLVSENISLAHEANLIRLADYLDGCSILLSGASGIVGLHILRVISNLVSRGVNVRGQLISKSGVIPPFENLDSFHSASLDMSNLNDLERFEQKSASFDYVIHAAGYGQPNRFMSDPLSVIALNVHGTNTMLKIARKSGARFLFLSSSEIYSGCEYRPTELTSPVSTPQHPRASYIEAKRLGETLCETYNKEGLSAVSARLALAYGPGARLDDGRVLNQFIVRSLLEGSLQLLDRGEAMRSYIFGMDAAIGLLNILTSGALSVYNIGGSSSLSILELAEKIGNLCGTEVLIPDNQGGDAAIAAAPIDVSLNVERYTSEFGQLSFTSLDEGLASTIDWYKQQLRN